MHNKILSIALMICTVFINLLSTTLFAHMESKTKINQYKVVDTGQKKFFNNDQTIPKPSEGQPFYGQDAQYIKLLKSVPFPLSFNSSLPSITPSPVIRLLHTLLRLLRFAPRARQIMFSFQGLNIGVWLWRNVPSGWGLSSIHSFV